MRPLFRTLKVDDAPALHALMVEHLESLEAGLSILGERVLLGDGTIDLVARDAEGRLVLVAVALAADDAMLLGVLEAFAWCLEHPDALGRLYAVSPADLAAPPRVMFVSGRLSDAFLRKVKYLRMPSIDCLEFRYLEVNGVAGLYFDPVAAPSSPAVAIPPAVPRAPSPASMPSPRIEPRVAAPAPAPRSIVRATPIPEAIDPVEPVDLMTADAGALEPVPASVEAEAPVPPVETVIRATASPAPSRPRPAESRPGGSQPGGSQPAELLQGLRLPENLSSQWQRILNRAVDAPDPAKIRAVREYLQSEFPGCVLYDFYEHQRSAQMFHLQNSQGDIMHMAAVADGFFEAEPERDIRPFLERSRLAAALRDAGARSVLITSAGLQIAKD